MNEDYIRAIFENVRKVNYYEDGESGAILKTCCIEFESQDAARNALERQSTQRLISGNPISLDVVPEWQKPSYYMLFISNIDPEVSENDIKYLFQRYNFISARVLRCVDGTSTSIAFIWLANESDIQNAQVEMQGAFCLKRSILVHSVKSDKNTYLSSPGFYGTPQPLNQFTDPNNTAVYVHQLPENITTQELRSYFLHFGEILYTQVNNNSGRIVFAQRYFAEQAINEMNNFPLHGVRIQLSWARPPSMALLPSKQSTYWPALAAPVYPSMKDVPNNPFTPFSPINPYYAKSWNHTASAPLLPPGLKNGSDYPYLSVPPDILNDSYLAMCEAVNSRLDAESTMLLPVHYSQA